MRPSARKRGYTRDWELARSNYLVFNPWCRMCNQIATVVDHITPHKGNMTLFWDKANWQPLCKSCHDGTKQQIEKIGYSKEIGTDGWPVDGKHPTYDPLTKKKWDFSIPRGIRPSAIPVTLVAGPPASGKTTYVREHKAEGDLVIDFDECLASLGYNKWTEDPIARKSAFAMRDQLIHSLHKSDLPKAWLIVMAPSKAEREQWSKALGSNSTWVVLDTEADECKRRVSADSERVNSISKMHTAIDLWYRRYTA